MIKIDAKAFVKVWCESIEQGGLDYVQRHFKLTKVEISGVASQLRKKLKAVGVDLPMQKKPGRSSNLADNDLLDLAEIVSSATAKPESESQGESDTDTESDS